MVHRPTTHGATPAIRAAKIGVIAVVCAVVLLVGIRIRNRGSEPYCAHPLPSGELTQLALDGWRADPFRVEPGVVLNGLVRTPARADAPWLLFFAGNAAGQLRGGRALLSALADANDFGLAVWANRGFDGSGGTPGPVAFHRDARLLHARLIEGFRAQPENIHLLGFSMGAEVAAHLAAELTRAGHPPPSLSLLSSYTPPYQMIGSHWYSRYTLHPDRYDPSAIVEELRGPVLVVHGTRDSVYPIAQARQLVQQLGPRAQLVVVPGEHGSTLSDPTALQAIREVVQRSVP